MARDEAALAERAQAGDQQAFRQLFERYHPRIYNYAAYMLPSPEDAADAAQDVFVKAWRGLRRLRDPQALEGWLWRIARNAVLDAARRRRAGAEEQSGQEAEASLERAAGEAHAETPAAELERQELAENVRAAIRSLPEIHREPLVMHYLQGMPVKEISEALKAPEGTVLSRLARGRDALKRRLGSYVSPEPSGDHR